MHMNWNLIEGNWLKFKGSVHAQWNKLTAAQLDLIAGKRDRLAHEIHAAYGISRHAAEWQLSGWQGRQATLNHA
jgi:uncharacterized protein YjbJ (UPF0337 family)